MTGLVCLRLCVCVFAFVCVCMRAHALLGYFCASDLRVQYFKADCSRETRGGALEGECAYGTERGGERERERRERERADDQL